MAALRLNIPVIFVSGGPMEAGKTKLSDQIIKLDLVDAMVAAADDKDLGLIRQIARVFCAGASRFPPERLSLVVRME